jgi:tetratricopeptide (TPR) repeat protein
MTKLIINERFLKYYKKRLILQPKINYHMAKKTKKNLEDKNIVAVEEALSRSEQFIERNQNLIVWVVAVIVLIIAGYIGFTRFILTPRAEEARAEMFMAEKYFENDDYEQALEGDGTYPGFLDIISDYRMTSAANLSRYYAGISYLRQGDYEMAIDHLKRFRARDQILGAMAYGAIGDAYLEMEDMQQASRYYRKAYRYKPNNFTTPLFLQKAGLLFEEMGEYNNALSLYERIKNEYPDSNEGRTIDRYIARAKAMK